jgi:hypothetical protein
MRLGSDNNLDALATRPSAAKRRQRTNTLCLQAPLLNAGADQALLYHLSATQRATDLFI